MKIVKYLEKYTVSLCFCMLTLFCFMVADVSLGFVMEQVWLRFIRNQILVIALILPIVAGMGLNFSVITGAMVAQMAYLFTLNMNLSGVAGLISVFMLTVVLNIVVGYILGRIMNLAKGNEMITGMVTGFLSNYIYQFIFMVGFGTFITVNNPALVLGEGSGVQSTVDLSAVTKMTTESGHLLIFGVETPVWNLVLIILAIVFASYIMKTPFGQKVRAIGSGDGKPENIGVDVDKTRIQVMMISTVLAGIGQFVYLQNMGTLAVYTAHMNVATLSCTALLAGGASIKMANVKNASIGLILMHSLFVLSPLAGQELFKNVVLGEYLRSFISYGVIALALVVNIKLENKKK